jgi:uncharacterized repeat protein (TIGR03803 family)
MNFRSFGLFAIAAFALAPGQSRAANLMTLVSFCAQTDCPDGAGLQAALMADPNGNLFGTTAGGGGPGALGGPGSGTVFEILKTASGYATTPTTLVSFNGTNGAQPNAALIADTNGNLFSTAGGGGANGEGTVFEIAKTASGYASIQTILLSFCSFANCTDGAHPSGGLIADANGNLFSTTQGGGAYRKGTVFEILKTASGYATSPITLVSFNGTNGAIPVAALIADANGNLFGTTREGGANGGGTLFKIAKNADGYATTPTTLVSFSDNAQPNAALIADTNGNLFGTTFYGGTNGHGTVFEVTDSGFVPPSVFAGTPGNANCYGNSVSALVGQFSGLNGAAAALGFSSVGALQNAIFAFCGG